MRIRTIKPDFFSDEDLQDLEEANPGRYVMLVFAGLWGNCDKQGVFEWRPRTLKLHILPFLKFDLADTLEVLMEDGFIEQFSVNGRKYGFVPTFEKHQRITGKEREDPAKYPAPPIKSFQGKDREKAGEIPGEERGSNGETPETTGREGKVIGREEERKPAINQSQSEPTEELPPEQASGHAEMSHTERMLRECVEKERGYLKKTFPDADIGLELEELVAKYRRETIGVDPWLLVFRWFRNLHPTDRASPDQDPPTGGASEAARVTEANRQACRDFAGVTDAGCG